MAVAAEALNGKQRAPSSQPRDLKSLELFTGAGGLALGSHAAGFQHVALVEWNRDACDTLRANADEGSLPGIQGWNILQMDARQLDYASLGPVDLVVGGAPCQPFSIGGKHRGTADERNMIGEFIRAVRVLSPRAFVLENVRGLLRSAFSEYFSYVLLTLAHPSSSMRDGEYWTDHRERLCSRTDPDERNGPLYDVAPKVLNAADYGVPQTRQRVFVVGFRRDLRVAWRFPEPTHSQDELLRSQWVTGEYWDRHELPRPRCSPLSSARADRIMTRDIFPLRPWRTTRDAIADLPEPRANVDPPGVLNHRLIPGARSYVGHTGSQLEVPAKTLKAGGHGVPGGENMIALPDGAVRYLTVREAARIQTFPDSWRFEGAWGEIMRQLGNAVPVELARVVASSVKERVVNVDAESAVISTRARV